ncbi:uncharacterized protein TNCV_3494221 [Trichonephila clavipes]|nr:uncharacterized protein TNCV_3494221 [Trichonephila clavipes]
MAFSRFSTGHLRCMNFEGGKRSFPICPKCNISQFSPQHILQCLGFSYDEAVAPPAMGISPITTTTTNNFPNLHDLEDIVGLDQYVSVNKCLLL